MNALLKKQRLFLAYTLLIKAMMVVALSLCFLFLPEFQYYFHIAVILLAVFALFDTFSSLAFNLKFQKAKGKAETTSAEIMGNELNEAYNFGEIGLAVTNKENDILWVNDFLGSRFPDIVDEKIDSVFPKLANLLEENSIKSVTNVEYDNHSYHVEYLKDVKLFVFKDTTELDNVSLLNQRQAPVVGYIMIDNYSDIQMYVSDEIRFADMAAKTRAFIQEFALKYKAMIRALKEDRYFFVTTKENFDKLYEDKFPIIDQVRKEFNGNGFTLSIGVAFKFDDYAKLSELASSALDVALSRGGDQAVISPFGESLIYVGGKTELKPNRNRVQVRELSRSLLAILKSYPKILIMGHDMADFDAVGSALGAYLLCKHVGAKAKICWEDQHVEDNARLAVHDNFTTEMSEIFINYKDCNEWIDKDTLLLAVDHNNPSIAMFSEIVKKMPNVAVIDHHRPGPISYSNYVFNGIDSSASSASEIITSYCTYNSDKIEIDERTATFLLGGIALDTHFFKEKATEATFEVAAQLKNFNANSAKVDDFLKENLEEYQQKISILNSNKMYQQDIMICWAPEDECVNSVMLSKVAAEAINIRGIVCAFCVGRVSDTDVKISARSDGSVNCQIIMQKLGGGGHFAMAACQSSNVDVDTMIHKLEAVLNDYLEDAKTRNN